jgi:hypothetical protein
MATSTLTSGTRPLLTRVLAATALLSIYCVSMVATTGAIMSATTTTAEARGGRGRGRGWRGRGWRGRGRHWVCRHNHWNSARRCYWAWW